MSQRDCPSWSPDQRIF